MKNMKWVLFDCVILLACVTALALPALASAGSTTTTTVTGTLPLLASNVTVSNITVSTATISWYTNGNSTSQVFYGTTSGYTNSANDSTLVLQHNVQLTGLPPNTTYHYMVQSVATIGSTPITAVSPDSTFNTSPPQPITVTANAQSKVYGTPDPPLTYISSINVTFTGALSRAPGENAGTYAINQSNLSAGSDYTIKFVSANLTIVKASTNTTITPSITSSANPVCLLCAFLLGRVTFNATVVAVAPSVGVPTGTVTFYDGKTKLGTGTLSSSGKTTHSTFAIVIVFEFLLSNHSITAGYSGDINFSTSTSPALIEKISLF